MGEVETSCLPVGKGRRGGGGVVVEMDEMEKMENLSQRDPACCGPFSFFMLIALEVGTLTSRHNTSSTNMHPLVKRTLTISVLVPIAIASLSHPMSCRVLLYLLMFLTLLEYDKLSPIHRLSKPAKAPTVWQSIYFAGVCVFMSVLLDKDLHVKLRHVDDYLASFFSTNSAAVLSTAEDIVFFQPTLIFFFTCCPNWTQACSHTVVYIPGPIGSLFAIAPTHSWSGNFATHSCT